MKNNNPSPSSGFTLIELSIALIIIGLLVGGLIIPLAKQKEVVRQINTQENLQEIKKVLIGYAQSNGRLPCPAFAQNETDQGSEGLEQPVGGRMCNVASGYLPAVTLGIQPTDKYGFALDEWGNRIRYAVSQIKNVSASTQNSTADNSFTIEGGMASVGLAGLDPNLRVCMNAPTTNNLITCTSSSTETNYLAKNAIAIIFSKGQTGVQTPGGVDELENLDGDNVFVSHSPADKSASGGEFDHLLVWISPYVLYQGMVQAGKLP